MMAGRQLPKGIYAPLPCFFKDDGSEDLDIDSFKKHVKYTSLAGTYPVISGTMGESPHLTRSERQILIQAAREALDEENLIDIPIVAGCSVPSTRESILIAKEAAEAGADFVIALTPGFYAGDLIANENAIKEYFVDIANASPVPLMMYNFPKASGGIDLSSDLIIEIAKQAPNVCGIKLTCANVGKLTRVTAVVDSESFKARYPRKSPNAPFLVIDGFIDFLLPSISSNASGAITGLANFAPKSCVKLWQLCQGLSEPKICEEAKELQNLISTADGLALQIGIPGMHTLLYNLFGYGLNPRRPLMPLAKEKGGDFLVSEQLKPLLEFEQALA